MGRVEVVLVVPGGHKAVFQGLADGFSAIEPPAIAGLLAGYLREKRYSVAIIDAPAHGFSFEETADQALALEPKVIVVVVYGHQPSASTQTMPAAREVCQRIKAQRDDIPIMMIGTHPSALPERTLTEESIDFVGVGEGFITIERLLQSLEDGGRGPEDVPGLCYRKGKGGEVVFNNPAPLLADLGELPGMAWDLLPMEKYRAHNWHCFEDIEKREPYAAIYTSFGCPFHCSFCCINAPFGKRSYRMFPRERVIGEIDILVNKYGVRNIKIIDEMFVLNEAHVLGICEDIIERGYDLNIWAYARVDTVREKFLDKLRRAGFRWLALGIESGSQYVRDGVEKGRFGSQEIFESARRIKSAGIYIAANYIFGLPDDDIKSMEETLEMALEINAEWANFYCAMAYPGSDLYRQAKEMGWALPDDPGGPGWIGYSQYAYQCLPLPTKALSAKEVLRFRDRAFQTYFADSSYLAMIRNKFGEKAVGHIREMTSTVLKRNL